jgi:hypothetical protein
VHILLDNVCAVFPQINRGARISNVKRPCNNLWPTPRIVANAEVITDGQNRNPQFGDSTADRIKTPGWDIGSTQDHPGEALENMPPPVRHQGQRQPVDQ